MTDPRRIIKDIRRIPRPRFEIPDAVKTYLARFLKDKRMYDLGRSQVDIVRERNFAAAQKYLDAENAREQQIYETRLKNLEKARKARDAQKSQ